jgi:hypothetical protein
VLIGMLGLIVFALLINVWYYENRVMKDIKPDKNVLSGFLDLERAKRGKRI